MWTFPDRPFTETPFTAPDVAPLMQTEAGLDTAHRGSNGLGPSLRFGGQARERLLAAAGPKALSLLEAAANGFTVPPLMILPRAFVGRVLAGDKTAFAELEEALVRWLPVVGETEGAHYFALRCSPPDGSPLLKTPLYLGTHDHREGAGADRRFATDTYRRFLLSFAEATGMARGLFDEVIFDALEVWGDKPLSHLTQAELDQIVERFVTLYGASHRDLPPDTLVGQLDAYIAYLRAQRQDPVPLVLQLMVFGQRDSEAMAGVATTSCPQTGEPEASGKLLPSAPVSDVRDDGLWARPLTALREVKALRSTITAIDDLARRLETHTRWVQRFDFVIDQGVLYLIGFARVERLSQEARFCLLVRLVEAGRMTREDALMEVSPSEVESTLHPAVDPDAAYELLASGLPASPGAACGRIAFSSHDVDALHTAGIPAILVRTETSPDDVPSMLRARGVVTLRGGMTSHAAVIARGIGTPCVTGATGLHISDARDALIVGAQSLGRDQSITIDGTSGRILKGETPLIPAKPSPAFGKLLIWANEKRRLKVRANADTVAEVEVALSFRADGIGLCRSEHMLLSSERLQLMRKMILAANKQARLEALERILPEQKGEFAKLFRMMEGLPVTLRLLDPPLHEFLPSRESDIDELARAMQMERTQVQRRISELTESNPMLGHRGCRLLITFPEVLEMQARAMLEAAADVAQMGIHVRPQIMVPLVAMNRELEHVVNSFRSVAQTIERSRGRLPDYMIGTMIELPRAALRAGDIAELSDFFSFGTNDLTQTVFGISRDDATTFLRTYTDGHLLEYDPFQTLDESGVGELMVLAIERGRAKKPELEIGICGEHGGDPASIDMCERLKLDYVSCSPFRVPVAQLAAAQSWIRHADKDGQGT